MSHRDLMSLNAILCVLFSLALPGSVLGQDSDNDESADREKLARAAHAEKVAAAIGRGELLAKLKHMQPQPKLNGPVWSAKGTSVKLTAEGDELVGKLTIGKAAEFPVRWKLAKPGDDATFSIDLNRDGELTAGESDVIKSTKTRGAFWYDGKRVLSIPSKSGKPRPYAMIFWYVASSDAKGDQSPVMRWSRCGWTEGSVKIGKRKAYVVMTEGAADGRFTKADSWGLGFDQKSAYRNSMNTLSKHAWLDGVAYKPVKFDPEGTSISFKAFDPGMTEEEERERNDPYLADKRLPRAKKPVQFGKNLKEALAEAKQDGKLVFVDFVTTWCAPCKIMDRYVYTAKPVVDRMQNVVAVQLDGDEEEEIVDRYKIEGYPTLLVLNADGEVLKRSIGYAKSAALIRMLDAAEKTAK